MQPSSLSVEVVDGVVVAALRCQDYTEREAAMLNDELAATAKDHGWKVALDVSGFKNLGSAGLGGILTLEIRCRRSGGNLVVFGAAKETRDLLVITHLDRFLAIAPDREGALRTLDRPSKV